MTSAERLKTDFLGKGFLVLLLMVLLLFSYANIMHYTAHMDADIASEAILAREIALNHMRIPGTWYDSTAIKLTSPANLAAILFLLTNNMNLSMGMACSAFLWMMVGFMACFYYRNKMVNAGIWSAVLCALVLSTDLNSALEMYALYAGFYGHVFLSLFPVLIWYRVCVLERETVKAGSWNIMYAGVTLIAIILGLQGMHGVLMLLLPILATEVFRVILYRCKRKERSVLPAVFLLVITMLSYLVAKGTGSGMTETTRNLRHAPEKFINEVVPAVERLLIPRINPVYTICAVLILIAGIAYPIVVLLSRSEETESDTAWAIMPLTASFLVMVAAMTFTTTEVAARYAVMMFFAAAGGYGLLIHRLYRSDMRHEWVRYVATIPVLVCTILSLWYNWNNLIAADTSGRDTHARIADMMVQKGVTKGYTTFDWANTITVVSNGEVQVCPVTNMADLEATKWLSDAGWYPPHADAEREVFYITSQFHDAEFREAISQRNINVLEEIAVDDYTMYLTDRDYTRLVEE